MKNSKNSNSMAEREVQNASTQHMLFHRDL